jgi:hypothetical protein
MIHGSSCWVKRFKWIMIVALVLGVFLIFNMFNPYQYTFYPKCIFHELTGFKCPGCGSQRAIHYLANLDLVHAFNENALLVLSIPYVLVWGYCKIPSKKSDRLLAFIKFLFGRKALFVMLAIVIAFWIIRNIR